MACKGRSPAGDDAFALVGYKILVKIKMVNKRRRLDIQTPDDYIVRMDQELL